MKEVRRKLHRWFQDKVALTDRNWKLYTSGFPLLYRTSHWSAKPIIGPVLRYGARLGSLKKDHTQGHVVPISMDLNFKIETQGVILPIDLVKNAIKQSTKRVILNECLCRRGMRCKDYPIDFGCIFLGEATDHMLKRNIARPVSIEEALEHLEKAAEMKLVCHCVWVEMESWFMGIDPQDHHKLMEICLCCPCCCVGLQNFKKLGPNFMQRFNTIGWKPLSNDACIGCGKCAKVCPMAAITVDKNSISISQECIGCGICASKCPKKAIDMAQINPLKDDILDYFWGFRPQI